MKKFFSMFIAIMCLCTCMVYAEDSKSTNVTFDIPTSYTWKAPASLELNENSPVIGTVEVTENVIPEGSKLVISLATENNFTVTSDEGATRTYTIKKGESSVAAGDTIMEVAAGTSTASQALNFAVESVSGKKAGTFKGTANFTASVKVPEPVVISKGAIVTMADLGYEDIDMNGDSTTDTFRVLSADGDFVKLLAMDSYKSSAYGDGTTTNFNGTEGQKYADSTLDTEMINYYNALPEHTQVAIDFATEQATNGEINQSIYTANDPLTASDRCGEITVGPRYVYALDVDDVIEYLGSDYTASPCTALREMFFNTTESVSRFVWLRSAAADDANYAFIVNGRIGGVGGDVVVNSYEVRPAFVINLG